MGRSHARLVSCHFFCPLVKGKAHFAPRERLVDLGLSIAAATCFSFTAFRLQVFFFIILGLPTTGMMLVVVTVGAHCMYGCGSEPGDLAHASVGTRRDGARLNYSECAMFNHLNTWFSGLTTIKCTRAHFVGWLPARIAPPLTRGICRAHNTKHCHNNVMLCSTVFATETHLNDPPHTLLARLLMDQRMLYRCPSGCSPWQVQHTHRHVFLCQEWWLQLSDLAGFQLTAR